MCYTIITKRDEERETPQGVGRIRTELTMGNGHRHILRSRRHKSFHRRDIAWAGEKFAQWVNPQPRNEGGIQPTTE